MRPCTRCSLNPRFSESIIFSAKRLWRICISFGLPIRSSNRSGIVTTSDRNATLHSVFPESAIFRIDHFLGKEAVEDVDFFRFANTFLEPIWNRHYVRSECDPALGVP